MLQSNQSNGIVGTLDSDSGHLASHWSTQQNMAAKLKACGNVTMGNGAARLIMRSDDYLVMHASRQVSTCSTLCRMSVQPNDEKATWLISCGFEGKHQQRRDRSDGNIAFCYLLSLTRANTSIITRVCQDKAPLLCA